MAAAAAAAAASMLNNSNNSNANHYQNQIDNQLNNPSVNSTSNNNNSGSVNGNEASMKCAICDRGFEYYSNLRRHIKTKHKIFGKQVKEYVIRHHNTNTTQMSQFQQAAALRKQSGSMNEPGAVNSEFSFASALKASNNLVLNKTSNSDQASSLIASNMMLSPQSYSRTQQNPSSANNLSYMDLALGSSNKTANSNGKNSPLSSLSSSSISSSRSMNRKSNSSSSGSEAKSDEKSSHANQNTSNNNNNNDESLDDDMDQAEVGSSASTASSSLSCSASPPLISSSSSSSSKLQFNPSLNLSQQQQQQQNIVAAIAAAAAAAAVSGSSNPAAGASFMSHPQMASLFGNSKMKTSLIESLLTRKLPTNKYASQSSEESNSMENGSDASQSKEQNAHKINNLTKLLQNIVEMNQMSQYNNAAVVAAALTRSQGQSPSASHMQLLENLEKQFNMPLGQLLNGNKMIKSEETESGKLASSESGVCTKANCDCDGGNLCNYGSSNDSEENDETKPNDDKAKDELNLMNINRRRRRRFQEPFSAFQPTKINKKENDNDESDEKIESQNENGDDIDVDIYDDDDNVIGREGSKLNGENSAHNSSANHHDSEMNGNGGYYENEMSGDLEENEYQSREEREKEKEDYEENEDEDNEDVRSRTSSSRSSQSAYSSSMSTLSKQNQLAVQASLANKMFLANSPLNQMALENHLRNLTQQHHSSALHHVLPHHHQQQHHHHHHPHQLSHAHQHSRNYNLNGMLLHGLQQQQQQQNLHQQARFGIDHAALLNPSGNGIRRKKSKDFGMGSTSSMVQSMRNLQCSPGGNNLDCITPPPPPIASSILMANSSNPPPSQPNSGDSNNQIRFSTEIWRCPYCCYETTSASRYNSHLVCHGWKPYLCPHCGSRSNRLPDMRTHISTFHPEFNVNTFVVLPEDEAKATLKDYMKNRALINRKLKEMRPQPKFKCKMCPYASLYQFNLTKHVKSVHLSDVYNNNNNNNNSNNNNNNSSSAIANDS